MSSTSVHRRQGRGVRVTALAAVGALVLTACGSRLTEDQIAIYADAGAAGGGGGGVAAPNTGGGDADAGAGGQAAAPEVGSGTAGAGAGAGGAGDAAGGGEAGAGSGSAASGGGQAGGDAGGDAGGGGQTGEQDGGDGGEAPPPADGGGSGGDTRAAPPGGNGGATDVGVTEDRIVVYNVADLTGAVPGLFRDAYEATLAYIQYFTATEGTVYGRQIALESRDTQLSSQGNRAAYLDACKKAFAAIGSMSAFEEGAAEPLSSCGMPDLRNVPTSRALQELDNARGMQAFRPGEYSQAEWEYYAETFPDAIANAGFVWLENNTTNYQVGIYLEGTKSLGYRWNKQIQIAVSETNYARIVSELKEADIQLVAFQGAYQQAARLAQSMVQQNYAPQVFALQQNNYTPDLIQTCGDACEEFVMVAQNAALLEEMDGNPELQLYAEWLQRVNPRARPTGLGMYSWAAAKLFVEALKEIGPEVTQDKLLEYLSGVSGYDANGLIPPQNVGTQEAAGCILMLDIEGGQFKRIAPDQGYRCSAGRVDL